MYSLMYQIREFIQTLIETTSSVIEFDIYVLDDNLIRVAGTGIFKESTGIALPQGCANDYVVKNGELVIIDNPQKNEICQTCLMKDYGKCEKEFSIIYPIRNEGKCIGTITIASLTNELKDKLLKMKNKLITFLEKLGEAIIAKIKEKETEDRLITVLNSISEGIVLTDFEGTIN